MTFRKDKNWPTRGTPVVIHMPSKQPPKNRSTDGETIRRWPIVVITATWKYLSEGIRVLGQSYSIYDDRGSQ
jgi:hypothetical protein